MHVVVVGSGPSGVHFALTAIERGHRVTLVDVGKTGKEIPLPQAGFSDLKTMHPDPVRYFLGEHYRAVSLPAHTADEDDEYYGLPASKDYVFEHPDLFRIRTHGISSLVSFAAGGLAECWTGGAYAFNDDDLNGFGFGYDHMAPYYAKVAERVGIGGAADDLAQWYPVHDGLLEPVSLDRSSAALIRKYRDRRTRLAGKHPGIRLGRSRQAALSACLEDRGGCTECGRCLWGCPNGAFYTPSLTLTALKTHPRFTYAPGRFASHFVTAGSKNLESLVTYTAEGATEEIRGESFVLAAGTINSSNLFLRTIFKASGEIVKLPGLMDNQQVLAPFLNLSMLGRPYDPSSYQYHQLAIGMETDSAAKFVHGQVTTMTTGSAHPVIAQIPLGMSAGRKIFTTLRSALGVVNLNFDDTRRDGNHVTLDPGQDAGGWPALSLKYTSPDGQDREINDALSRLKRFMRDLGAPLVPGMTQIRRPGASVHYSGTLPISPAGGEFTVTQNCRSNDFENLFVVDGSVFPALPSKNLTFTLMANATRVATEAF